MYCPQCGQERISEATSFCSRCGYLLTGTAELIKVGGVALNSASDKLSPRAKGIRQGLFMFLLMFLVAPILGMISTFVFKIVPWPMGIAIFVLGVGGLLRMAYAMMFEPNYPLALTDKGSTTELNPAVTSALPSGNPEYISPIHSVTADTAEMIPPSVTDNTTKLLEKDLES